MAAIRYWVIRVGRYSDVNTIEFAISVKGFTQFLGTLHIQKLNQLRHGMEGHKLIPSLPLPCCVDCMDWPSLILAVSSESLYSESDTEFPDPQSRMEV